MFLLKCIENLHVININKIIFIFHDKYSNSVCIFNTANINNKQIANCCAFKNEK